MARAQITNEIRIGSWRLIPYPARTASALRSTVFIEPAGQRIDPYDSGIGSYGHEQAHQHPPTGHSDPIAEIERLARLWAPGGLSDPEFKTLMARALSRLPAS